MVQRVGKKLTLVITVAACVSGVINSTSPCEAASATPSFRYFDVSQPGVSPPSAEQQSAAFLVINLNPLRNETVTVTGTTVNSQNTASQAPTTAPQVKSAALGDVASDCGKADKKTKASVCYQALNAIDKQLGTVISPFDGVTAATATTKIAADVEGTLQSFASSTNFATFQSKMRLRDAAAEYETWVVHDANFGPAFTDLSNWRSTTVRQTTTWATQQVQAIKDYTDGINDGRLTSEFATVNADLTQLQSSTITTVTTAADTAYNQIKLLQTDPSELFVVVNAPCERLGFNSRNYTIKLTRGNTAVWEDTVSCFSEFSIGAMYYVDWLNSAFYSLQSSTVNGTAVNVITKQTNNLNQGSIAAAFDWCPADGPQSFCGTAAASTTSNGLDVLAGLGYLFAHRALGFHAGVHISQINVLTNGYSVGSVVPNGATFTRKQISGGLFVGFTLNIPSK